MTLVAFWHKLAGMLSLLPWYDGSYTPEKLEPPYPDLKPADVLQERLRDIWCAVSRKVQRRLEGYWQ
jgi:hypothetical protein